MIPWSLVATITAVRAPRVAHDLVDGGSLVNLLQEFTNLSAPSGGDQGMSDTNPVWDDYMNNMKPGDTFTGTWEGHEFQITATDQTGFHTGRMRYRVYCLTCTELVHEATTGPLSSVRGHGRGRGVERAAFQRKDAAVAEATAADVEGLRLLHEQARHDAQQATSRECAMSDRVAQLEVENARLRRDSDPDQVYSLASIAAYLQAAVDQLIHARSLEGEGARFLCTYDMPEKLGRTAMGELLRLSVGVKRILAIVNGRLNYPPARTTGAMAETGPRDSSIERYLDMLEELDRYWWTMSPDERRKISGSMPEWSSRLPRTDLCGAEQWVPTPADLSTTNPEKEMPMGEKKELREENASLRRQLTDIETRYQDLERENNQLRYGAADPGPAGALERRAPGMTSGGISRKLAAELGITGEVSGESEIVDAIDRLKNPDRDFGDGPQVTKGDSLAEAITHNSQERKELLSSLTAARAVIQRVAGALGVGQWDSDGTELIEKAQRWGTFAYSLKRRGEDYVKQGMLSWAGVVRAILVEFVAPPDLAKFVAKLPEAPQYMVDIATEPTSSADQMSVRDVKLISDALQRSAPASARPSWVGEEFDLSRVQATFLELANSSEATASFRTMMNLVILPHLRRLRTSA